MITGLKLELMVRCESCQAEETIKAVVSPYELRKIVGVGVGDYQIPEKSLPDLWEYHTSHGWGSSDRSRTQLLCFTCVRKWRDESILEQMARKASEESGRPPG